MSCRKLIVLDDEEMMLKSLERRFKAETTQYSLSCFTSIKDALEELDKGECYAFITDVKMPLLNGDQVVGYIRQKYPEQSCLVITGYAEKDEIQRIVQVGNVKRILSKPLEFEKLLEALDEIAQPPEDAESGNE